MESFSKIKKSGIIKYDSWRRREETMEDSSTFYSSTVLDCLQTAGVSAQFMKA